jgi:hypothetical protein
VQGWRSPAPSPPPPSSPGNFHGYTDVLFPRSFPPTLRVCLRIPFQPCLSCPILSYLASCVRSCYVISLRDPVPRRRASGAYPQCVCACMRALLSTRSSWRDMPLLSQCRPGFWPWFCSKQLPSCPVPTNVLENACACGQPVTSWTRRMGTDPCSINEGPGCERHTASIKVRSLRTMVQH